MYARGHNLAVVNFLYLSLLSWAVPSMASQENICAGKKPIFYCEVASGANVALCPKYTGNELIGIQYGFVRGGKEELMYPYDDFDLDSFQANHFSRYQVDYKAVRFSIGRYRYSVYSNYDAEDVDGASVSAGVAVFNSEKKMEVQMPCARIYVNRLEEVIPLLQCDNDDAMGCWKMR